MGENCSSACVTKDHKSFGECLRAKSLKVAYCGIGNGDATSQRQWDQNLDAYAKARAEGIQPSSTSRASVDNAVKISNETGVAFQA